MRRLFAKSQTDMLAQIRLDLMDEDGNLWQDPHIYRALNMAIESLAGRVLIPKVYAIPDSFSYSAYTYTIPPYVGKNFVVQAQTTGVMSEYYNWYDVTGWTVESSGNESLLRISIPPYSASGRILWYGENSSFPLDIPTLDAASYADDDSEITLDSVPDGISPTGYIRVEDEVMFYAGVSRETNSVTLQNLTRGLLDTSAAAHAGTELSVAWMLVVDDARLWEFVTDRAIAHLHNMRLHRGTQEDRLHHEKMMGYHMQRADGFWRRTGYVPAVGPRVKLGNKGVLLS